MKGNGEIDSGHIADNSGQNPFRFVKVMAMISLSVFIPPHPTPPPPAKPHLLYHGHAATLRWDGTPSPLIVHSPSLLCRNSARELHPRLPVNPLSSHQPAHQALSHQQEDQQQEKGRDPYLSTNSSRRKEMILCPPTPLYQIPCMIRSGRSSMTHGRELIRPSTTQWSKRTGTSGD